MEEGENILWKSEPIRTLRKSNHLLPLVIIFSLGLLPLSYFRGGSLIFGGDTGNYMFHLLDIHIWDTISSGTGIYNPPTVPLGIPYQIFYTCLNIIGVSLPFSQALLNSILFIGAGLSMYFLVVSLNNETTKLRFIATGAAIFYMFNPYNMMIWSPWVGGVFFLSAYASYPLLLALFVRGLRSKRILKSGIFFGLGSLIFISGNVNIPFTIITIFSLLLYFIFHLIFISKNAEERIGALRFAFIAMAMYLLLNLWWIAPIIPNIGALTQNLSNANQLGWLETFSSHSSILNVLRLYGYPGWENYFQGRPGFSYVPTLMHNPFFIVVSFLPPVLFGIALMLKNRWIKEIGISKFLLFIFLFYLLSIFLSKGVQDPFGGIYLWLFEHMPGFVIFRSVFVKFGIMIALSSAILFGASLFILYQHIENTRINALRKWHIGKVMIAVFIVLILVFNYPLFTGEVIQLFYHQIPTYYFEAANFINGQTGNFKLLQLYGGFTSWVVYNWGGGDTYIGIDVDPLLINKPIIHSGDSFLSNYITQQLAANSTIQIDNLLTLMNVKYILLHNDINPAFYGFTPSEVFKNSLSFQKNISLEETFGEIDLYINEQWQDTQVYPASHIIPVNDTSSVVSVEESIKPGWSALFFNNQLSTEQLEFITSVQNTLEAPQGITYTEINPTKYIVNVNVSEPFFLVSSDSYHKDWVAYVDGQQVPDEYHFMANGYANAWYINKTGTYTITLEYWPQKLFYISSIISITTLILFILQQKQN